MLHQSSDGRNATSALTGTTYTLDFEDTFDSDVLDRRRWLPYYLPHWSSRELSAARYRLGDGTLRLLIEADQQPWQPDGDGGIRVSSLQTGMSAGPVGSRRGQVRFHPGLVVREAQPELRLYTPRFGLIEVRARATADPRCMVALWLIDPRLIDPRSIDPDDRPEGSTEICVCEIYGRDVTPSNAAVGVGLKSWGPDGPGESPDFSRIEVPVDAREFHTYAVEWTPERVGFFVDDQVVKVVDEAPQHALQLMLDIYEFPEDHPEIATGRPVTSTPGYPKEFVVDHVRGYGAGL